LPLLAEPPLPEDDWLPPLGALDEPLAPLLEPLGLVLAPLGLVPVVLLGELPQPPIASEVAIAPANR
jgi:hypothetical protein